MQPQWEEAPLSLTEIDLTDSDLFVAGPPHHIFRLLRREAPVFWQRTPDGSGHWTLTKYEDIVKVELDPQTFSSARLTAQMFDPPPEEAQGLNNLMLYMDPPRHTKYRRLISKGFTPKMIAALEPRIQEVTAKILDRVAEKGECDFVTEVAAELPLQVIVEMMGVPPEDRHQVFEWSNVMIGQEDPEYSATPEDARRASMELYAYAHHLAERKKHNPGDDITSVLLQAEVDGEELSQAEFDAFFLLLSIAGNETTRNLISGGLLALLEHPEEKARLQANPSLLPTAVEEMLRWVTPVMHFRRTATCDAEIRGQRITEGDKVVMWYISANRDEDVFHDPDRFDVGRTPNDHLTFGAGGPHFCLGSNLARLEIRVMFEELLRRLRDIELAGPVQRLRSNFIAGIKHMPVRFTPEGKRRAA